MDWLALIIGYVVIYTGSFLLISLLVMVGTWSVLDLLWRRYGDWKLLTEFLRWKRLGWSPFDKDGHIQP